jgi:hypothetical protein
LRAAVEVGDPGREKPDRFGYLGLIAVADDEAQARRRSDLIAGYVRTSPIVSEPFRDPPGYLPPTGRG